MKVVVTGATGNVGVSVVEALSLRDDVDEIVGIARRKPEISIAKVRWEQADVTKDDLGPLFAGADSVVHLVWAISPMHNRELLRSVNVGGSRRVFQAAVAAKVSSVVYASSLGVYAAGPKDHPVDESWSTAGLPNSQYSIDKSEVESLVDVFEQAHPDIRWVRLRPGLVLKPEAAAEIRRFFLGRFPIQPVLKFGLPVVPKIDSFSFQVVHASDLGEAFTSAVTSDVRGAFNIAAAPVLDSEVIANLYNRRKIPIPRALLRGAAALIYKLRIQPTEPGWLDILFQAPTMDTTRAETELEWNPKFRGDDTFKEFIAGFAKTESLPTPPLKPL